MVVVYLPQQIAPSAEISFLVDDSFSSRIPEVVLQPDGSLAIYGSHQPGDTISLSGVTYHP